MQIIRDVAARPYFNRSMRKNEKHFSKSRRDRKAKDDAGKKEGYAPEIKKAQSGTLYRVDRMHHEDSAFPKEAWSI